MRIVYFIILFKFVCNYAKNQGLSNSLADMNNVLGAKNLLPNNAKSQTVNGVTFTVNSDGSITANGTATTTFDFPVLETLYTPLHLYNGVRYIISGCPQSPVNYNLQMYYLINGTWSGNHVDVGDGTTFTAYSDREYGCNIHVDSGAVFNNVIFYPMLRPASIEDNTYVPYSMTNREMTSYVQSISNPNLLDNPWFTVNQRGQNVYTSESYTVDRWRLSYGTGATTHQATVNNDNSITIECEGTNNTYFRQKIENELLSGNDYTVSIKCRNIIGSPNFQISYSDGTYGITHIVTGPLDTYTILNLSKNSNGIIFNIHPGESITLEAVKIEKGSVSTLAMDSAPNYQQELAKCQRYFVRFSPNVSYTAIGAGIYSSNRVYSEVTLPTVLRTKPNVSYSTIRAHSYGRNDVNVSSIVINNYINNIVSFKCIPESGANFVNGDYCEIQLDVNNYLDLSADL